MVEAKTVDKKIKVVKKEIIKNKKEMKDNKKVQSKKNAKHDSDIELLKAEIEKLKKKKVARGHVSEYNIFIRKQIKSGMTFIKAAKQWSKYKTLIEKDKRRPSAYNQFIGSQMRLGKTWMQSVALWKLAKSGKLGKKGSTRIITKNVFHTRTIKSKPTIKYRTKTRTIVRNIKSKPTIKYRTRTVVSKPTIKYRTRTIVKNVKAKPVKRTVTRIVRSAPQLNVSELTRAFESSVSSHSISKNDLKEAFSPDSEEIAFKMIQTYFIEIARQGFKRQLTLDEIINAYFYALARVKRKSIEMDEVSKAVKESGMTK